MKTERVTFLAPPEFKLDLRRRASATGISVGELIRRQFAQPARGEEEEALQAAALELKAAVKQARAALSAAHREVADTLATLQTRRARNAA